VSNGSDHHGQAGLITTNLVNVIVLDDGRVAAAP
jgi:hypothetical protein